ncbi:hypothetical protein [Mesorhizobium sp. B2-8-5]|uniref:hypothetical protein n=1 Tax=Mesorhizobium sp. B2-8-5 TaxID=2589903 RepID=UPI0011269613|nr:hypothetical protein [Mesorhizobium sp. B2-8-5]UCI26728.1 hypothetical protein FJ430_03760 [Mesorhizobium sp. B2-8-5]
MTVGEPVGHEVLSVRWALGASGYNLGYLVMFQVDGVGWGPPEKPEGPERPKDSLDDIHVDAVVTANPFHVLQAAPFRHHSANVGEAAGGAGDADW